MAHSGLRYLVLLVGVVAALAFAYGLATRRPLRAERGINAAFVGFLDLQVLLGLILMGVTGTFGGQFMGHMVTMILALVVAHAASIVARRSPDARRALTVRLVGVVLTLALVAAGILAIRGGLFESRVPLG